MNQSDAARHPAMNASLPSTTTTSVRGSWLLLMRIAWGTLSLFALGVFMASLPGYTAFLHMVCSSAVCTSGQLSPEVARTFQSLTLSLEQYTAGSVVLTVLSACVWFAVAGVIAWRKSDDWMALLVALMLVLLGTTGIMSAEAESHLIWRFPAQVVDFLAFQALFLVFCLFPHGRFVPRWTCWLCIPFLAVGISHNFFSDAPFQSNIWFNLFGNLIYAICGISLAVNQIYRYRRVSNPLQRQQTKWVVFSLVVVVVMNFGLYLPWLLVPALHAPDSPYQVVASGVQQFLLVIIPLALGIAILRYRLWDIDIIINRTLVYGLLTASVIGSYVLVVGVLGTLLQLQGNLLISLLATGLVAVLFQPLRTALQRAVNRLMYGERDEPYKVISRLGSRLEATLAAGEVLPAIVETVAHSLKLPYVAISLKQGDEFRIVAFCGTEPGRGPGNVGAGLAPTRLVDALLHLPLTYQAETIGELILAPRVGSESFTGGERQLLNELARQAGIAVHGVLLTADLERSRQRIVAAREEARRQLGSDLHDGLGHMLTSVVRKVESTSLLLEQDAPAAQNVLLEIKQQTKSAIDTTRQLAHSLHPPELELLGLVQALCERVRQYDQPDGSELHVTVDAPPALPPLPIAVEAAAYYIALEAVNNVYRHAGARNCSLRLELLRKDESSPSLLDVWNTDVLTLEVCDDGSGLPEGEQHVGLGLSSMYERAAELGGACLIENRPTSGTRVYVRLPCIQFSDARG